MDDSNIIHKIEECCNNLYKATNNQTVQEINGILSNFISFKNYEYFKILLYQSSSKNAKFYAANALTNLITENYLSVGIPDKIEMYENLINFIGANSEDLYSNSRFLLNILITLLCRIVRISWLQNQKFKSIIDDVLKIVRDDNTYSMMIPFLTYTELIYQFQLPHLPPKNKLYKYIIDFKETALLCIYESATNFLINIFNQEIKFEKIELYFLFINELSKCINECMEYEEDLNIKDDIYKKYEIKPIYVPNKKRVKDKTLNIDLLNLICRNLFDTHNIIAKLVKDNNLNYNFQTDQCLCLLQKYCSIKIVYLGENKLVFLKNIQNGIISLIQTKLGLDKDKNLEEFCKLIFLLKKNFTVIELLDNLTFIEHIYRFTLECIQYYPVSCSGLIYLLRFFGYFSSILSTHPIPSKEEIKALIQQLVSELMKKIFSLFDNEIHLKSFDDLQQQNSHLFLDLIEAVALISRGIYTQVNNYFLECFSNILSTLNNPDNLGLNTVLKINYLLFFTTAVISFNQQILIEKNFIDKVLDQEENERICVNDINVDEISIYDDASENLNECQVISGILTNIFQILEFYYNSMKKLSCNLSIEPHLYNLIKLEPGLFYFLKNFCKLFLSKKLSQKYSNIFFSLSEALKLKDNTMILNFIIAFLIEICKFNPKIKNDQFLYQKVVKIFQRIVNNAYIDFDPQTGNKLLHIGKLHIEDNFLNSVFEMTETLVKLDPVSLGKYRTIFYQSLNKIILMKTSAKNDELFSCIINFYSKNIFLRKEALSGNESVGYDLLGYMKDIKGICSSINIKEDYNKFITSMFGSLLTLKQFYKENCHIPEVNISTLKLIEEVTNNRQERIYFSQNSTLPIELLDLANEILQSYKSYLGSLQSNMDSKDEYIKKIKPTILILKIFKNIFQGKYIHFGSLFSMKRKYMEGILLSLCDLLFSMRLENILSYLSKANVCFYIIKVIFCEYSTFINQDFYKFGDDLVKLLEEGVDSLDNIVLITTHQIIFEMGKLYVKSRDKPSSLNNCYYTGNNNQEIISFLFGKFEENFQNILTKLFHSILNGEITSLSEMSNSFFVLVNIYNTFYLNLSNNCILTQFGQDLNRQQQFRNAFDILFRNIKNSLDSYNLLHFQKGLKEFAKEIQTIV